MCLKTYWLDTLIIIISVILMEIQGVFHILLEIGVTRHQFLRKKTQGCQLGTLQILILHGLMISNQSKTIVRPLTHGYLKLLPDYYIVCYFLYSCQRATNGRNVICEVQVSQPLLAPLDSKTGVVHRFSHDEVDGDEEEKRGDNATLLLSSLNVEHLCISNACFHTVPGIKEECLEYIDEFVWDPVTFQYFPEWLTVDAVKSFLEIDEVDYQGCLGFKALFNYSPQGKDVFTTGSSVPKASLFFSQSAVNTFS